MVEKKLTSGRVTSGVARIGNTIHRPQGDHSPFVHRLLKHLEGVRFEGAPRFLGVDEFNSEILSYIPGDVPPDLQDWSDNQLVAAAKLIRGYHDATAGSDLTSNMEVLCHNDLTPCNTVIVNKLPIAFIDFDVAKPGLRKRDLAYAVWMWCCLGEEEVEPEEQGRRIKLFCDANGLETRKNFIDEIIEIQREHILNYQRKGRAIHGALYGPPSGRLVF